MLAYDYPLLGIFWTSVVLMMWILWFTVLFRVIADIFRSDDLGGVSKTLWLMFVLFLPFLGVFVYVIVRGKAMGARAAERAYEKQQDFDAYVRETASTGATSTADELSKLAALREQGVLTQGEFDATKAQLLA